MRAFWNVAVWAGVISAFLLTTVRVASAETIQDYLVQQVCLDLAGAVTSEDPVTCPGRARKLTSGEMLPYHKWDMPQQSNLAQISDSYPIQTIYGQQRVVSTFYFTRDDQVPYFAPGGPNDGISAYDLGVTEGAYASFAGTYDQGGGWQPFWRNAQCSLLDSWIIAPIGLQVPFGQGQATTTLTASFPQCPTVDRFSQSMTRWNYYPDYLYQSGKRLNTIKSWHFSQNSSNSDAIEVFMFTREYGKTKWEAWQSSAKVSGPNPIAVERCGVGTDNGVAHYGNTTYYLVDCHDWTFIFPAANGGWDPANFHIDPLYTSQNLLSNTHMRCTDSSGRTRICGQSGSQCRVMPPWQRIGDLNWGFNQSPQAPRESANCAVRFSIPSAPSGQSIYQDTSPLNTPFQTFTYGAALKAPYATGGNTYPVTVVVHQIDANGSVVSSASTPAQVGLRYRFFKGSFARHPNAQTFRFEIYVGVIHTEFEMTDAWVAP